MANIPFDAPGQRSPSSGGFSSRRFLRVSPIASRSSLRTWSRIAGGQLLAARPPGAADGHRLGACLAQAATRSRGAWGWRTLKCPRARSATSAYRWFLCHCSTSCRDSSATNEVVRQYRAIHRIAVQPTRSRTWRSRTVGWKRRFVWQAGDPASGCLPAAWGTPLCLRTVAGWRLHCRLPGATRCGGRRPRRLGCQGVRSIRALITTL